MTTVKLLQTAIVDRRELHVGEVVELREDAAAQLIRFGWAVEVPKKKSTKKGSETVAEENE